MALYSRTAVSVPSLVLPLLMFDLTEIWRSVVLGLVQGLTEFLPISSSAHLILFPRLVGWPDQGLAFDIAANTGTLAALVVYFRADLARLLRRPARDAAGASTPGLTLLPWLMIATVPVGLFGWVAAEWIADDLRNPKVIAVTTVLFGVLLWVADRLGDRPLRRVLAERAEVREETAALTWLDAAVLGVAQAIALIPGTSRSGIVMTAGLFAGFDRASAARLAFLMAIPVGALVAFKDVLDLIGSGATASWSSLMVGFLASAVSGYMVIAMLLEWLQRRSLGIFVAYRLILGLVLVALFW